MKDNGIILKDSLWAPFQSKENSRIMEHVLQSDNMTLCIVLEWTITCHITDNKSCGVGPISWCATWIHTEIPIRLVKLGRYTFECFNWKGKDKPNFSQVVCTKCWITNKNVFHSVALGSKRIKKKWCQSNKGNMKRPCMKMIQGRHTTWTSHNLQ